MPLVWSITGIAIGLGANALVARWPTREDTEQHSLPGWVLPVCGAMVLYWLANAMNNPLRLALLAGYVGILLLVAGLDVAFRLVPNAMVFPATLAAVALGPAEPLESAGGAILGLIFFGGLYWLGAYLYGRAVIGMGDVKLAMLLGAIVGADDVWYVMLLAMLLGGVVAAAMLIGKRVSLQTTMPYGLFLVVAGLIILVITAGA